jgi:hypothetical protein
VGNNPYYLALGDFNGDGISDMAVANFNIASQSQSGALTFGQGSVSVLQGRGDGTFFEVSRTNTDAGPLAVVVADFDADGFSDIAFASARGAVDILYGKRAGRLISFWPRARR